LIFLFIVKREQKDKNKMKAGIRTANILLIVLCLFMSQFIICLGKVNQFPQSEENSIGRYSLGSHEFCICLAIALGEKIYYFLIQIK
jgi:hypothetical protein